MANPPSFVGYHIAERLSIPLIMTFTMPWTPTSEFPSPFVKKSALVPNFKSFLTVDRVIWIGIRDIINDWRENELQIPPIRTISFSGHRLIYDSHIPFIYCFSEELLPRPHDWGRWIRIAGFYFLDAPSNYEPPEDVKNFLAAGEAPIFIGFGSIVVADPNALTGCVMKAIELSGQRAIVQQGWAGMKPENVPDNVLLIGRAPHDWLFERCSLVIHHGGAGTTSVGLRAGKPTVVVPFFGDQFFWGDTIARRNLGKSIPHAILTPEKLAEAIKHSLTDEVKQNAIEAGMKIRAENGVENGIKFFRRSLPLKRMKCDVCEEADRQLAKIFCDTCKLKLCLRCDTIIHNHIQDEVQHNRRDQRYIVYNKNSTHHAWYHKATALHAGFNSLQKNVGHGLVDAVNVVSNQDEYTLIKLGKGMAKVAGGLASGGYGAVTSVIKDVIAKPEYQQHSHQVLLKSTHPHEEDQQVVEKIMRSYQEIQNVKAETNDFILL